MADLLVDGAGDAFVAPAGFGEAFSRLCDDASMAV
jgi:hypothetical protein